MKTKTKVKENSIMIIQKGIDELQKYKEVCETQIKMCMQVSYMKGYGDGCKDTTKQRDKEEASKHGKALAEYGIKYGKKSKQSSEK